MTYDAIRPREGLKIEQPIDWESFPGSPIPIDVAIEVERQQIAFFQHTLSCSNTGYVEDDKFLQKIRLIEHYLRDSNMNVLWGLVVEPNPDEDNYINLAEGYVIDSNFGGDKLYRAKDLYVEWERMLHSALGIRDLSKKFAGRPPRSEGRQPIPVMWTGGWYNGVVGTDIDLLDIFFIRNKPVVILSEFKFEKAQMSEGQRILYEHLESALENAGVECNFLLARHSVKEPNVITADDLMVEDKTFKEAIDDILSLARDRPHR